MTNDRGDFNADRADGMPYHAASAASEEVNYAHVGIIPQNTVATKALLLPGKMVVELVDVCKGTTPKSLKATACLAKGEIPLPIHLVG